MLDEDDYLDADPCCEALAAAEVVAAWAGVPAADLDDKVRAWVAQQQATDLIHLIEKAQRVLARVRTDSELKDLWEETDSFAEWQAVQANLKQRLGDAYTQARRKQ
ncbi:MAG: DUF4259 domain-containing protein [Rhodospirillales bacterium]|nr:DUF4259 domain-containing protein [Rhodospirillales bacterium]